MLGDATLFFYNLSIGSWAPYLTAVFMFFSFIYSVWTNHLFMPKVTFWASHLLKTCLKPFYCFLGSLSHRDFSVFLLWLNSGWTNLRVCSKVLFWASDLLKKMLKTCLQHPLNIPDTSLKTSLKYPSVIFGWSRNDSLSIIQMFESAGCALCELAHLDSSTHATALPVTILAFSWSATLAADPWSWPRTRTFRWPKEKALAMTERERELWRWPKKTTLAIP